MTPTQIGQSTPPADYQPDATEIFNLAARLAGVQTVDLLKVRWQDESLVVILCTGQKFVFDPSSIAAELAKQIGEELLPAPAPKLGAAKAARKKHAPTARHDDDQTDRRMGGAV